ncbi:MAG: FAD-dependent oxidoreductase [Phycisphaerales bacterium]|nr:FAD-dependent oxidoreductase [Phycisphaerales bacterium]
MKASCAVIGSGVVGLSAAIRLVEAGRRVVVYSADGLAGTCSSRSGAGFTPLDAGGLLPVIGESFRVFSALAEREPSSGVRMLPARQYQARPTAMPEWLGLIGGGEPLPPTGPYPTGFRFVAPHIDMTVYLGWLARAAQERYGVPIVRRRIGSAAELHREGHGVVVNCSGLGARELAGDPAVRPMRGQVVHVPNDIALHESLDAHEADGRATYLYPHPGHIVLGGTYEPDVFETSTVPTMLDDIVSRCRRLLETAGLSREAAGLARVRLRSTAGLRPARLIGGNPETIRLEREMSPTGPVVHCYGHGRAGVTLSWGCAREVARLAE